MIERRRSKRKKVDIKAEIILDGKNYPATIENISEHGLNMETTSEGLLKTSTSFNAGNELEVKFQIDPGETLTLHCKIIWSFKTAPLGLQRKIGVEIIFPPPVYINFYRELK